jgi:hypothetical protein
MPKKRNVGGISLTAKWKDATKQEVLDYFLENSDFKILTDTSVSCITYVATLHPDKESPFFSIRSELFQQHVRSMLMKVCIHTTHPEFVKDFRNPNNKAMETMPPEDIIKEVKIQDELFRKSYIENVAEPICPSILYVQTDISKYGNLQEKYYKLLDKQLIERNTDSRRDHEITHLLFNNYRLSVIFMELAEGYSTLYDLWTHPMNQGPNELMILQNLLFIAMYELYQLYHKYGIVHGDIHFGNILVNPHYHYLGEDTLGKILIIDFGKSFYETPDTNKREYDTVIYHRNTQAFETILSPLPDREKNDFFKNRYVILENSRKKAIELFLNRVFPSEAASLEKWKSWSDKNIHYPYQSGGLYHVHKNLKTNQITYNKMNDLCNKNKDPENNRYIILDTKRDDFIPKVSFQFTAEDWYNAGKRFDAALQNYIPAKVEPLSPKSAENARKIIADTLNTPLEIQQFQNPYMYPIGNPKIIASVEEAPSSVTTKKPKNTTKRVKK